MLRLVHLPMRNITVSKPMHIIQKDPNQWWSQSHPNFVLIVWLGSFRIRLDYVNVFSKSMALRPCIFIMICIVDLNARTSCPNLSIRGHFYFGYVCRSMCRIRKQAWCPPSRTFVSPCPTAMPKGSSSCHWGQWKKPGLELASCKAACPIVALLLASMV